MRRIAICAVVFLAFGAGCSSKSANTADLGDTVYVDSGGGPTPAGVTRSDFDDIAKAGAADDQAGLAELVTSGVVVLVDACAPAKLIDTAFGGERQVRIESTSQAVWVDANWLKGSASDCD